MESRLTEGLRLHCNHRSNTARNEAAYGSKQAANERFMRFKKPAMSVSFLIGSFGDLPFEKPQNFTTHCLRLSHGIMNGQNAGYDARGECDFDARVEEEADCASWGGKLYTKRGGHCTVVCEGRGGFAAQLATRVSLSDWLTLGAKGPGSEVPQTIERPSSGCGGIRRTVFTFSNGAVGLRLPLS